MSPFVIITIVILIMAVIIFLALFVVYYMRAEQEITIQQKTPYNVDYCQEITSVLDGPTPDKIKITTALNPDGLIVDKSLISNGINYICFDPILTDSSGSPITNKDGGCLGTIYKFNPLASTDICLQNPGPRTGCVINTINGSFTDVRISNNLAIIKSYIGTSPISVCVYPSNSPI